MNILESLIDSMVRLGGEALVLHTGDKPYVIVQLGDRSGAAPAGDSPRSSLSLQHSRRSRSAARTTGWSQVELSAEPLQSGSIWQMLRDALPADRCRFLRELGAVDYEVRLPDADEPLTLTAASSGDDELWVEVRRRATPQPASEEQTKAGRTTLLSIARPVATRHPAPAPPPAPRTRLDSMLAAAASQGATSLYVSANAPPMIRAAGRMARLREFEPLAVSDIEPAFSHAASLAGPSTGGTWAMDVAGVGRVRCVPFVDEAGAGMLFELPGSDALVATEAGLEPAVRALAASPEGLAIVAGPRSSGKSTLLDTFVDLINRSRTDHVITIGTRLGLAHTSRSSFVSQRIVHGGSSALASSVRAALREGPDVLAVDGAESPEVFLAALEAARSGRMVFASVAASSATAAVSRAVAAFPPERQAEVRALLADTLRAVVWQVLVETRTGGARVAARELLLGTPAVAQLILRGMDGRLTVAVQAGRRMGMKTLEDSLVGLVRARSITAEVALRTAPDAAALTRTLQREGLLEVGA